MYSRAESLKRLLTEIDSQKNGDIEVLTDIDEGGVRTTGHKRNELLARARGEYVAFVDDDDMILPGYVPKILEGIKTKPDVIGFRGYMTTNKTNRVNWIISKDMPYELSKDEFGNPVYLRFNNHLSPVKKEIALQIGYPDKFIGEDYDYAVRLVESKLIKTEYFIDDFLYHYDFVHKGPQPAASKPSIRIKERKVSRNYVQPKSRRRFN